MRPWLIGAYWASVLAVLLMLMNVVGRGAWAFMFFWWIPMFVVPTVALILYFILFQRRTERNPN